MFKKIRQIESWERYSKYDNVLMFCIYIFNEYDLKNTYYSISTRILIQNIIHVNNMKYKNLRNHNEPYFTMLCNKYYYY